MKTKVAAPLALLTGALFLSIAFARGDLRDAAARAGRYRPTEVRGTAFPKTLVTGGTERTLPGPPRRIASLTTTSDDIVTSLASPDRIVAVTPFADDPVVSLSAGRAPASAARIRGADPERVIALTPDVVFTAHYTLDSGTRLLGAAHIPAVRLRESRTVEDVLENLATIAAVLGEEERGRRIAEATRAALRDVEAAVHGRPRPRVLYYSGAGYTAGRSTLVDDRIRIAGGRNVAAEAGLSGFADVSLDLLVALDPEVILVPAWTSDTELAAREITGATAWRDVQAVRSRRVHALPASVLTSESPDGLVSTARLAKLIHPEAFP